MDSGLMLTNYTRYLGWLCICSIDQILIPGQGSDRLVGVASELFLDSLPESRERLVQVEREVILQVLPEPLNRVELWAVGRQKDQANVLWYRQLASLMEPPVVQNQDVCASREPARESVEEVLEALAVQSISFEKKSLTRGRLDRPIEVEVLISRLLHLNRLNSRKRDSTSCDRHEPKPTLVLAEQPNRPAGLCSNLPDSGR